MTLGSCICWNPHVNTPANPTRELDKLASAQGPVRRSNVESNEALIPLETSTSPLVFLPVKDLFIKFIKVFMETTQAQALIEP